MTPEQVTPALRQLLAELPQHVSPQRVDRVWLFAPRDLGNRESGLLVLSLLPPDGDAGDPDQRELVTLEYEVERGGRTPRRNDTLTEQGRAPAERIPRLIQGVLHRLGDAGEDPLDHEVAADPERWRELLDWAGVDHG